MSKKSQQDIVDAYPLHRECVRRNAEYAEAYRQVAALTQPAQHDLELVRPRQALGSRADGRPARSLGMSRVRPETVED